jgi:hypothetical protein
MNVFTNMKSHPINHVTATVFTAILAFLALAACSKGDRNEISDKTKDVYQGSKDAVAAGWNDLKTFSFEKRDAFTAEVKARQAQLEAEVSKLKAEYSEAQASASRKAAMAELKDSEANYKEKLAALGNASGATWDAARDDVIAAWDRLQAAYAKARAS